jgi:hypothetical protein
MESSTYIPTNFNTIENLTVMRSPTTTYTGSLSFQDGAIIAVLLIVSKGLLGTGKAILRRSLASHPGGCSSTWSKLLDCILFQHGEFGMSVEKVLSLMGTECVELPTSRKNEDQDLVDGPQPTTKRMLLMKFKIQK